MRADIERFLAGKPVVAPVVPLNGAAAETADPPTAVFSAVPLAEEVPERRKRWPLIVTMVATVVLIALAVVLGQVLLSSSPEEKTVPQVVNMTQAQAEKLITDAELEVGTVSQAASDDVPKGRVIAQDPDALSTLTVGGGVDLTVSTGRPTVVVPYVIGEDKEAARQTLLDAGLKVKLVKEKSDATQDTVIRTTPNAADSVSTGSLVTVFFSAGPTEVPSVVGLAEDEARKRLEDAGFRVETVVDTTTVAEQGTVLKQSPEAFTPQPQDTTVVVTVSGYVEPTPTPTPTPLPTPTPGVTTSPTVPPPA